MKMSMKQSCAASTTTPIAWRARSITCPVLLAVTDETFAFDSVKFHKSQTSQATLLNPDGTPAVTLDYRCPIIAFWSPYKKQAPFVCIEPWYGLGDHRGYDGEFKDKPYMNHLQPGASFMSEYTITIG